MVDGENVETWAYSLITCAVAKECIEALQKPMPYTRADAAARITSYNVCYTKLLRMFDVFHV